MYESKSLFAKRIGKPLWYVCQNVRRGKFPCNARGFVNVEQSLKVWRYMRSGRPKIQDRDEIVVAVKVYVKRKNKKIIKELVREIK